MDLIASCYRYIPREKLEKIVDDLAKEHKVSKKKVERYILEDAIENLNIDGLHVYWKLESRKHNKTFYLFGECHNDECTCKPRVPQIQYADLMEAYIIGTVKPIDFFFEAPYQNENGLNRGRTNLYRWNQIYKKYGECLKRDKTECLPERPNIRMHYADFRDSNEPIIRLLEEADNKSGNVVYKGADPKALWDYLRPKRGEFVNLKNKILSIPRLQKQFDAIKDVKISRSIRSYLQLDRYDKAWAKFFRVLEKYAETGKKPHNFKEVYEETSDIFTYVMDIYLLARVFRSYQKIPGRYSEDPSTIFVYAGAQHIKTYGGFLKSLGFKSSEVILSSVGWDMENFHTFKDFCIPVSKEFKDILRKEWL